MTLKLRKRDGMAVVSIGYDNYADLMAHIEAGKPFQNAGNTLSGHAVKSVYAYQDSGRMPQSSGDYGRFCLDAANGVIDYIIYSYSTPIAWHTTNAGWYDAVSRYSVTTSKHQGKVSAVLSHALFTAHV